MPRYLGPADALHLEEGGRAYKLGDDVPISPESAEHLGKVENGGHRFEGVAAAPRPRSSDLGTAKAEADKA